MGTDESAPMDPEPTEQVIEEPVMPPEGERAVPEAGSEGETEGEVATE